MAIARAQVREGLVYVEDVARGTMVVLTVEGAFVREHRFLLQGDFLTVSPNEVIGAAWDPRPDRVGYPLHRVDLLTGQTTSTGSVDGRYVPGRYDDLILHRAAGDEQAGATAWFAKSGEFRLEHWDAVMGRLLAVIGGRLDWFPRAMGAPSATEPPVTLLTDFVIDRAERVWVLTRVPDPRWRTGVVPDPVRAGLVRFVDPRVVWDSRLDVFDLRAGTHASGPVLDDGLGVALALSSTGDPLIYSHIVDLTRQTERLVIHQLRLEVP